MKTIFTSLSVCFCFLLNAQQKGASPITGNGQPATGSTYAVVVGISDYQDEGIPDLRFADKDALAFAGFLQSKAGGSLDEDHLKVLINEKATVAQFAIALDWLWEVVKENDRVIIYFSGHGDVERKSITQPGYLLCWDAPSKIYLAGGALALPMFQDVITTLSAQNKAKVVVITDACRSGKLSGSSVGGAQITGSNLARQYANEIKILSCQPDEYSIEGEQWGGGRGAFSYHLLDGLYGMADRDNDQAISLREIDRYLEDHVTPEVAPQNQLPMIIGDSREKLTDVFPEILAQLKERKKGQLPLFTATESRGIEDDVLAEADTNIVEMYFAFQKALDDKQFLFAENGRAENDYAEHYYQILSKEPQLQRLHSSMRRNYAAALQDDAQQVMNEWMKPSLGRTFGRLPNGVFTRKVRSFPACLERAAELLGKEHYMYATLQARKYFFEGYFLVNSRQSIKHIAHNERGIKALEQFRLALEWQPEMPHAYWQMMMVFGSQLRQPDSTEIYAQKAMELYPSWNTIYIDLAYLFSQKFKQFDRARPYLEQATLIDSSEARVWNTWGTYYKQKNELDLAVEHYKKVIELDSTYAGAFRNLGNLYTITRRFNLAEQYLKKGIQLDSTRTSTYGTLGRLYRITHQYELAEQYLKKTIQLDSTYIWAYGNLGSLYIATCDYDLAEQYLKKAIRIDSTLVPAHLYLGRLYRKTHEYELSEQHLKKTIQFEPDYKLGFEDLGLLYTKMERYEEGIEQFKRALHFDSAFVEALTGLGSLYANTSRYEEAEKYFKKAIQLNPVFVDSYYELSKLYYKIGRATEAEIYNQLNLKHNSTDPLADYNVARLKSLSQAPDEAFHHLEEVLKKGYKNFNRMQQEEDLTNLRKQKQRWGALMKKYFPEQHKTSDE